MSGNRIPTFQGGNTIQFTFVSSVSPDSAPSFSFTNQQGTLVVSVTATQSDATHFFALATMPDSDEQYYLAKWLALKTVSGSAYQFVAKHAFKVNNVEIVA